MCEYALKSYERVETSVTIVVKAMYKTVYQEKHGRLTIRERSYSLTLFEGNYCEADPLPVPIERIRPLQAKNRLSEFVRDYLAEHPNADLFDRLTKIA